jgi:hypothetical protein
VSEDDFEPGTLVQPTTSWSNTLAFVIESPVPVLYGAFRYYVLCGDYAGSIGYGKKDAWKMLKDVKNG